MNQEPASHAMALLAARRCSICAERVAGQLLLAGEPCPRCGAAASWRAGDDLELDTRVAGIMQPWRKRRLWVYGLTGGGALLAGTVPLAATAVTLVALVMMRHTVLRAPLCWLGPRRRVALRLVLRFWLVLIALLALLADEVLSLLPVVSAPVKAGLAVGAVALYLETSLALVANRVRREHETPALDSWEWALPLGALMTTSAAAAVVVLVFLAVVEVVQGSLGWLSGWLGSGPW